MMALVIMRKLSYSAWASLMCILPKSSGTKYVLPVFKTLNATLIRNNPIPKVSGIILELERFQYVTALD